MHFCLVNVNILHEIWNSCLTPHSRPLSLCASAQTAETVLSSGRFRPHSPSLLSFTTVMSKIQRIKAGGLIHSIEALCILDGDMQFLPQLLERFIRRQVQTIEAFRNEKDIRMQIKSTGSFEASDRIPFKTEMAFNGCGYHVKWLLVVVSTFGHQVATANYQSEALKEKKWR